VEMNLSGHAPIVQPPSSKPYKTPFQGVRSTTPTVARVGQLFVVILPCITGQSVSAYTTYCANYEVVCPSFVVLALLHLLMGEEEDVPEKQTINQV
jgi:hypothetical protein